MCPGRAAAAEATAAVLDALHRCVAARARLRRSALAAHLRHGAAHHTLFGQRAREVRTRRSRTWGKLLLDSCSLPSQVTAAAPCGSASLSFRHSRCSSASTACTAAERDTATVRSGLLEYSGVVHSHSARAWVRSATLDCSAAKEVLSYSSASLRLPAPYRSLSWPCCWALAAQI